MLDVLIRNGLVVDGSGRPGERTNVAVQGGKIYAMNAAADAAAKLVIDAAGLVVAPGFIDVHSHNDLVPFGDAAVQELKLRQGVTTELVGQCGLGVVPSSPADGGLWQNYIKGVVGDVAGGFSFFDMADYRRQMAARGLKNNVAALVSHGALRATVMGFAPRAATEAETAQLCALAEQAFAQGALGLSLGLQYMPGIYSERAELSALAAVVARCGKLIMVHLRNHDRTMSAALREMIDIAAENGAALHISHMRSYDSAIWGCPAAELIRLIDEGEAKGIRLTFDEHLYLSGSTLLTQLLPPWLSGGPAEAMRRQLADNATRERLKRELQDPRISYPGWDNYSAVAGWDGVLLTSLTKRENRPLIGRTVAELAAEWHQDPVDVVAELLLAEGGGVGIVTMNIFSEQETLQLIRDPRQMFGSDSIPAGVPHPRLYGNYPLLFGKFVRDRRALTLEEAVYKAARLPALTIGLPERGLLETGKVADIVLFDFTAINGYEEYRNSRKRPVGIRDVIVNGQPALLNGQCCAGLPGRMLPDA